MNKTHIHIDFETFSSVSLKDCGLYKYTSSPDFEILLCSYLIEGEMFEPDVLDVHDVSLPDDLVDLLLDENTIIHAHNAMFERLCLRACGIDIPASRFRCSMAKSAYCGLPLGLGQVAKVLQLEQEKDTAGALLIKYFCTPCKPSKVNGGRTRNLPEHDPAKWERFKEYCKQDTAVEYAIDKRLSDIDFPNSEQAIYELDQNINDRGVCADLDLATAAIELAAEYSDEARGRSEEITGLDNVNSVPQLREWVQRRVDKKLDNFDKETVKNLLDDDCADEVREVLENRQNLSKTSIKKYTAILNSAGNDNRVRGLLQYYGAMRTGRWAGRLVQIHNLPKNQLEGAGLGWARAAALRRDRDTLDVLFDNSLPDVFSQLIRTAFVAEKGNKLVISDFSAIEARVTAWLAGEAWRMDVFSTHGKIYEASAAKMFKIPIEQIDKHSPYRQKGKVAELALGYQGGVGALDKMGAAKYGWSEDQKKEIIRAWRKESPNIVKLWKLLEEAAKNTIRTRKTTKMRNIAFHYLRNHSTLAIELPSGRALHYKNAKIVGDAIVYEGLDATKNWGRVDTYGGKLTENIVQALSRDLLTFTMLRAEEQGAKIAIHVHDEVVCETKQEDAQALLDKLNALMAIPPDWASDLPLKGDGFTAFFYQK